MRRALELAERGAGYVNPNPLVGCVVVKDDVIVAEGYHARVGGDHAEANALHKAGDSAQGAHLYVNYEPCVDFPGKRTPACADRIVDAGIERVVVATRDPTPDVNGQGVERLRAAGVDVVEGVLADEARRLNEIHATYATTGRPFVLLKSAMSLDGKTATRTGDARWISSKASRQLVHRWRHCYAAVLVGAGTALNDDPRLTVRHVDGRDPIRVVLDSHGRIPPHAQLFHLASEAPTIVATVDMSPEAETALRAMETPTPIEIWRLPANTGGRVDLHALMEELGRRQIDSVLLEGGAEVAGACLSAGLIDKASVFIAPKLIGGGDAPGPLGGAGADCVDQAVPLRNVAIRWSGPDIVYTGYPHYEESSDD